MSLVYTFSSTSLRHSSKRLAMMAFFYLTRPLLLGEAPHPLLIPPLLRRWGLKAWPAGPVRANKLSPLRGCSWSLTQQSCECLCAESAAGAQGGWDDGWLMITDYSQAHQAAQLCIFSGVEQKLLHWECLFLVSYGNLKRKPGFFTSTESGRGMTGTALQSYKLYLDSASFSCIKWSFWHILAFI